MEVQTRQTTIPKIYLNRLQKNETIDILHLPTKWVSQLECSVDKLIPRRVEQLAARRAHPRLIPTTQQNLTSYYSPKFCCIYKFQIHVAIVNRPLRKYLPKITDTETNR